MSIYNSEATLRNTTGSTITIGILPITAGTQMVFWDTSHSNSQFIVRFLEIKNNQDLFNTYVENGSIVIAQDSVTLTYSQFLTIFRQMVSALSRSNHFSELMTTGIKIDTVKENDGRQIITPSPIGIGWNIWFTSYDDDLTQFAAYQQNPLLASGRGEGSPLLVEVNGEDPDPTIVEFQFAEPIHIHDGELNWGPDGYWDRNDYFSVGVRFEPSEVEAVGGTGNCNLVEIIPSSGMCIIIPANGDGAYNLTHMCPIRNTNRTGYWDVDDNTGDVFVGVPGQADFDLYNFAPPDAWFMKRILATNSLRTMQPDSYRTEMLHPCWKLIMSVTKTSPGEGWMSGWFTCFRKNIT